MRIGIRPTVDVVFKRLFASPANANLTRSFLNDLLPLAGAPMVQELDILNPFRLAEFAGDKEVAVDVRARDPTGREFQVEMQVRNDGALLPRILDNWSRLYSAQIGKGEDYRRHRPVVAVWILARSLFGDGEWLHCFRTEDRERNTRLGEDFLVITVELGSWDSLPEHAERATLEGGIDEWLWFLCHGESIDPESPRFNEFRAETQEAAKIMAAFTKQEKARHTYERRLEWERTINAWKIDARAEGLAEGKAEGLAEGKAEGRAEGKAEGIAEGLAQGRSEGKKEAAIALARRLKDLGVAPELILQATGVDPGAELSP